MAVALLHITEDRANPQENITHYKNGLFDILNRLSNNFPYTPNTSDSIATTLDQLKTNLNNSTDIFSPDCLNIHRHPNAWPKTSRIGASDITIDGVTDDGRDTYHALHQQLMALLKALSWFNRADWNKRKKINLALNELEQWHADAVSEYIARLRDITCDELINRLDRREEREEAFIEKIEAIKRLRRVDHLATSTQCLEETQKINALRNDIIAWQPNNQETKQLASQLSVISKRWIDPFYASPLTFSDTEKRRRIARMVITCMAEALAVTALILFFVFPPAAFPVGVAAAIGMWPILDDFFEVARNIWYGRTPTKQKALELGLGVAVVFSLTFMAYGVAAIGESIIRTAPRIAEGMISFGSMMANVAMRFIDAVLNGFGVIFDGHGLKQALEPASDPLSFPGSPASIKQRLAAQGQQNPTVAAPSEHAENTLQQPTPLATNPNNTSNPEPTSSDPEPPSSFENPPKFR